MEDVMKQSKYVLIALLISTAIIISGCQSKVEETEAEVAEVESPIVQEDEIAEDNNSLEPITLNDGETINALDAPDGYHYMIVTLVEDGKDVRKGVPVPTSLFNEESECLSIKWKDVTPYLEENYPNLKGSEIDKENNPDIELLDETSLTLDEEGNSSEYVNNEVIINDVVSTEVELPKEAVRQAVESFAQSFGPVDPSKLAVTTLPTDSGPLEVYIYEYEHDSDAGFSRVGVFFPYGSNMHLMQIIQEGDISSPSPFLDALNEMLSE